MSIFNSAPKSGKSYADLTWSINMGVCCEDSTVDLMFRRCRRVQSGWRSSQNEPFSDQRKRSGGQHLRPGQHLWWRWGRVGGKTSQIIFVVYKEYLTSVTFYLLGFIKQGFGSIWAVLVTRFIHLLCLFIFS